MSDRTDATTAVITGAASGIGAATARRMAAAGHRVVLVDLDDDGLSGVRAEVEDAGGSCHTVGLDLLSDEAPATVVGETLEAFGSLNILVHAAGVFEQCSFATASRESLDRQWAINARVPFLLSQAALPHLRPNGVIIFVSSISGGPVAWPNSAAYCLTKGAIWGLTRALAVELAPEGVRVNAVAPGTTDTPMNASMLADRAFADSLRSMIPVGRIATVDDIAAPVVFLASADARHICGETLIIDGGYTAA